MKNRKWVIAGAAALAVAVTGGVAGIAAADDTDPVATATSHVDGFDAVTDDFNDHYRELGGELCDVCRYSQDTDLVMMWQSILVVDGFLATEDPVDGFFGPDTKRATAMWQDHFGVDQTGTVNAATWREAGSHLSESDGTVYYVNEGSGELRFTRYDDGHYTLDKLLTSDSELVNQGGDRIEFYNRTIDLVEA